MTAAETCSPIVSVARGRSAAHACSNPYSSAGLRTRMWVRVTSSGTHWLKRSNRTASSGFAPCSVGCGQSLPQTMVLG